MGKISKVMAMALILVMAISSLTLLIVEPANAQTITTPSIPQFTVKFIQGYYNNTYSPINNTTYTTPEGATELIIKNQPFVPPDNLTDLYYSVRLKGQSDENWTVIATISEYNTTNTLLRASTSENTTVAYPQWGFWVYGQVDFQVEALVVTAHPFVGPFGTWSTVASSGWSNTKTVTVPVPVPVTTASPSPTPSIPELSWLVIVPLLLLVFSVAVIVKHRKTANLSK